MLSSTWDIHIVPLPQCSGKGESGQDGCSGVASQHRFCPFVPGSIQGTHGSREVGSPSQADLSVQSTLSLLSTVDGFRSDSTLQVGLIRVKIKDPGTQSVDLELRDLSAGLPECGD